MPILSSTLPNGYKTVELCGLFMEICLKKHQLKSSKMLVQKLKWLLLKKNNLEPSVTSNSLKVSHSDLTKKCLTKTMITLVLFHISKVANVATLKQLYCQCFWNSTSTNLPSNN
jgi:hypothetical protein